MKLLYCIVSLLILTNTSSCLYTQIRHDHEKESYNQASVADQDNSILFLPDSKIFYRYKLSGPNERSIDPELILASLKSHRIRVIEAWYLAGSSHTNFGNGAFGNTIVRPSFVVGLSEINSDIYDYHFEQDIYFDPVRASKSGMKHFIVN